MGLRQYVIGFATVAGALTLVGCFGSRDDEAAVIPSEEPAVSASNDTDDAGATMVANQPAGHTPTYISTRRQPMGRSSSGVDTSALYTGSAEQESGPHGEWLTQYDNGQVFQQGNYWHGNKHGQWTEYYPNGQLLEDGVWDNGVAIGIHRAWLADGTLITERDMSRGID